MQSARFSVQVRKCSFIARILLNTFEHFDNGALNLPTPNEIKRFTSVEP